MNYFSILLNMLKFSISNNCENNYIYKNLVSEYLGNSTHDDGIVSQRTEEVKF